MAKSEKKSGLLLYLLIIVLIAAAYGALAFNQRFWPFSLLPTSTPASLGSQFIKINREVFPVASQLNKCGDWPITVVPLSEGRGNPFARKGTGSNLIASTSTAQCQAISQ